ncbi:hypothetical protein EB796_009245 [Bugula neritina]|uniref:Uncharacterized protein n=1 Tax=Bugula neritina TaxID=10212 RepID=A0A7J7K380_BUGNE|nr:hypothetical protein EB796_009245 [Bugula neritina]
MIYFGALSGVKYVFKDNLVILGFVGQLLLCLLLLFMQLSIIPAWLQLLFSALIQSSSLLWLLMESICMFHLAQQISKYVISFLEHDDLELYIKGAVILLSTVMYSCSALLAFRLFQAGHTWCTSTILVLGVVSFCMMLRIDEGNILEVSLLLFASISLLYSIEIEMKYNTTFESYAQSLTSNGCNMSELNIAGMLMSTMKNTHDAYHLWLNIFNPISVLFIVLRIMFVLIYNSYRSSATSQISQRTSVLEEWSNSTVIYHILMMLLMIHTVHQYLPSSTSSDNIINLLNIKPEMEIILKRFFQSCLLQIVYIYFLYSNENDTDF